jgi:hypothetical protein
MSIAYRATSTAPTLEQELAGLLHAARLQDRQARAVAARLGWDGDGCRTLAAAAAIGGYSRERVRQLEDRVRSHARGTPTELAATRHALRHLEHAAPIALSDVPGYLEGEGLSERRFELTGLLSAAELTGIEHRIYERAGVVLCLDQARLAADTALHARRLVVRNGAATIQELVLRLSEASPDAVRRLLDVRHDVTWLDSRQSWFLIRGMPSRASRTLQKMLSVSRSLSIAEIDHGLRRAFRPVRLPVNIVRLVCAAQLRLTFDRSTDIVTADAPLEQSQTLSPLEQKLVAIFREAGPTLSFTRAVQLATRDGINPSSVGPYLTHTPIVQTLARGRYALCGQSS